MSAASNTLRLILIGEDRSASKAAKGVGDEVEKSGKKMQTFHKVGTAAGVALAGGLVLAGKAALTMTKKAAEDQQAASRLAQTLHSAAGATDAQVASTEDWITAQGKAYGVADDDLRPALSKLAVATGSVTKAQKLAKLAMDVSAGSGKSLESVSFALAKAQNGNVAGLARLGVKTTKTTGDTMALEKAQTAVKQAQLSYTAAVKAHGKTSTEASIASDKLKQAEQNVGAAREKTKKTTLSLDQITKNLAATYGGAAAKNADTVAGKQKIMAVQMQELQEQIGTALLPAMSNLVSVGLRVVSWISNNTRVTGILIGVIGALAGLIWTVSTVTKYWAAITKIATAAQWLWNAALADNPIGLVAIALGLLVIGLVEAYKHSETFRRIVQAALHGVLGAAHAVGGFFTGTLPAAFNKVKTSAASAIGWVKSHWPLLLAILSGPFGLAVLAIAKNWSRIKEGASSAVQYVKAKFSDLMSFFGSIPSRLTGMASRFLSAGKTLGAHVISGIFEGLRAIGGFAGDLAGSIKGAVNSALHLPFTIKGPGPLPDFTIPAFAKGGIVNRPTIALIGEAGPEAVVPLGKGHHGMGGDVYLTVNANGLVDPQSVARRLESELAKLRAQGNAGRPLAFM